MKRILKYFEEELNNPNPNYTQVLGQAYYAYSSYPMPLIYDPTDEENQFAEQFNVLKYDKKQLEDIPSRKLCLTHKKLKQFPDSKIYMIIAHASSMLVFLTFSAFYMKKHPHKFMDMKKLTFRHLFTQSAKISFVFLSYFTTVLYLIVRNDHLYKKYKIREDIEFELLRRNTYLSQECREKSLGQMLNFYGFSKPFIDETLSKIDKNLENKIDFEKFSL